MSRSKDPCSLMKENITELKRDIPRDEKDVATRKQDLDALLHQKHPDPQQVEEKKSELHKAQAKLKNDEGQLKGFEEEFEARGCH